MEKIIWSSNIFSGVYKFSAVVQSAKYESQSNNTFRICLVGLGTIDNDAKAEEILRGRVRENFWNESERKEW